MTISLQAAKLAFAFTMATPRTGSLRERRDRAEFGGPDSYLLKVRRIGRDYPFGSDVRDGDFGIYVGLHEDAYVVAIQSIFPAEIIGYERFQSLEDLRRIWELD